MKSILLIGVLMTLVASLPSQEEFDDQMLWGTYKPQLIHAVTQRRLDTFNPITLSLMYFQPGQVNNYTDLLYKVPERKNDKIKYLVTHQDGKRISVQDVLDPEVDFDFRTSFLKFNNNEFIDEVRNIKSQSGEIGIIYTFALEQNNPDLPDTRTFDVKAYRNGLLISVTENGKEETFYATLASGNNVFKKAFNTFDILQLKLSNQKNWDPRSKIFDALMGSREDFSKEPNVVSIVFTASKSDLFTLQVQHFRDTTIYGFNPQFPALVRMYQRDLEREFKQTYFSKNDTVEEELFQCAFQSYSQLMAGLQFSYGDLNCTQDMENCKAKKPILSHTPSRYGYPRPFLWDEGFHNTVDCYFRPEICLQSLNDWLGTQSKEGWIPREQPRGEETVSYTLPGLTQDLREENPPTFFFDFEILQQNYHNDKKIIARLEALYPKIKLWYHHWMATQAEHDKQGIFTGHFKWYGPSEDFNLGSGIDDFPRKHKGMITKWDVDGQSWGYMLNEKMLALSQQFDKENTDFHELLKYRISVIKKKLHQHMLDPSDLVFKDVLYDKNDTKKTGHFSPHLGYLNVFPLAMGMIDPSNETLIEAQLRYMTNESYIWTEYGLRSLSVNDDFFGKDLNYWRGPIWINVHYMLLRSLKKNYSKSPSAMKFYDQLRSNIINTVCGNFKKYKYFFEHYNFDLDGQGSGFHPFNGWTATIGLIISEKY